MVPARSRFVAAALLRRAASLELALAARLERRPSGRHLATFAKTLERLRSIGTVDAGTRVVAVHLAHDNPPLAQLGAALAECGAEVLPDGAVILLG